MIRAYNALRDTHGGPFASGEDAYEWATKNLPDVRTPLVNVLKELAEDGRAMVCEKNQDQCVSEDVVIFDDERHEMDEDGCIEW